MANGFKTNAMIQYSSKDIVDIEKGFRLKNYKKAYLSKKKNETHQIYGKDSSDRDKYKERDRSKDRQNDGIAYRLRAMLEKILNYDLYSIKQNKPKRQKIRLIHSPNIHY